MSADRARSAAYELHTMLDGVEIRRVEIVGRFPNRAEARRHMIDTTAERQARDSGDQVVQLRAGVELVTSLLSDHGEEHLKGLVSELAYTGAEDCLIDWRAKACAALGMEVPTHG